METEPLFCSAVALHFYTLHYWCPVSNYMGFRTFSSLTRPPPPYSSVSRMITYRSILTVLVTSWDEKHLYCPLPSSMECSQWALIYLLNESFSLPPGPDDATPFSYISALPLHIFCSSFPPSFPSLQRTCRDLMSPPPPPPPSKSPPVSKFNCRI